MGARRTFPFGIRPDLVYVLRAKVLSGKERLKTQGMVWLTEQGVEGGRRGWESQCGSRVQVDGLALNGEGHLIFQD